MATNRAVHTVQATGLHAVIAIMGALMQSARTGAERVSHRQEAVAVVARP